MVLLLKMAHWLLARPNFYGSILSRRLMTNCATTSLDRRKLLYSNQIVKWSSEMKKLLIVSLVLTIAAPAFGETLTQGERERAMSELHATRKQFLDSVAGLSDAQWNFKPAPDVRSVAEVAEHIAVSEDT